MHTCAKTAPASTPALLPLLPGSARLMQSVGLSSTGSARSCKVTEPRQACPAAAAAGVPLRKEAVQTRPPALAAPQPTGSRISRTRIDKGDDSVKHHYNTSSALKWRHAAPELVYCNDSAGVRQKPWTDAFTMTRAHLCCAFFNNDVVQYWQAA